MSNTPTAYDAESEAYFHRYPELRAPLAPYGANGARLHFENFGQKEGRTWGAAVPAPTTPMTPPETVSTQPLPASYGTSDDSWASWLTGARQATEGMNQMPFVFSDYGSVPIDDKAAQAMFYPQGAASSAVNALTGGAPMQAPVQGNAEQYANPLIAEVSKRGSMSPDEVRAYMAGRQNFYGQ